MRWIADKVDEEKYPHIAERLRNPLKQGNHARNFAGPKVVRAEIVLKRVRQCEHCGQDIWQ